MEKAGFDAASWSHWLLIICFVGVSAWGLALSWQWGKTSRTRRKWNRPVRIERKQGERSRRLATFDGALPERSSVVYKKSLVSRSVRSRSE